MSNIIGAPNEYQEIEWRTVTVADMSELQAAMEEMSKDGWFPLQNGWGKQASAVAIKPTFYIIGWRVKPAETAKVTKVVV